MAESTQPGYEARDASVRLVVWFAAILVGSAIIIHLALAGLYKVLEKQHPSPDAPSRIALNPQMIAPEPRLQSNPQLDLEKFNEEEAQTLNSYGWVDREHGVIRIPIERAIDLIVERGLPTRGAGTNNSSGITPEQLQAQKAAATDSPTPVRGER